MSRSEHLGGEEWRTGEGKEVKDGLRVPSKVTESGSFFFLFQLSSGDQTLALREVCEKKRTV